MSSGEEEFQGRNPKEVQANFFLRDLPEGDGEYRYRSNGLNAAIGTVVLFQYQKQIIASATLDWVHPYSEAERESNSPYCGAFYFNVPSIRVFKPISLDRMKEIWPAELRKVTSLRRAKFKLDCAAYPAFQRQLENIRRPAASPAHGTQVTEESDFMEAKRLARERYFFVRNPQLARKAKERDQYTCQICSFNFFAAYGELGRDYAECHHLDPLPERAESAWNREITTKIDRVATLCANCHRMVHHKRPAWPIERVGIHFAEEEKRRGFPYSLTSR